MAVERIATLCGHPMRDSFCNALVTAYRDGAKAGGATVREIHVTDLEYDPVLWRGYREIQALEEGLLNAQETIRWAQHLVIAFPVWWGVPPALLKGFFDRTFHPGFAFKYKTPSSLFQDKLLKGRSARLICTMDSPPWYYRLVIGAPGVKMMKRSVLKFCGISPVRTTLIGSVRFSTRKRRERWLDNARKLGERRV